MYNNIISMSPICCNIFVYIKKLTSKLKFAIICRAKYAINYTADNNAFNNGESDTVACIWYNTDVKRDNYA